MKVFLVKKGAVKCERLIETGKLPPFYRLVTDSTIIGLHEETQLAPKHHGEYYALWGKVGEDFPHSAGTDRIRIHSGVSSMITSSFSALAGVAVYVYVEPEHVWATEWWIDDVLVRTDIGGASAPAFLSVFPGGVVVPLQTPGDPHFAAEAKFCVLDELTLQSPWGRKAIYRRAEVVYYQDPPAQPLKRLLDI